MQQQYTGKESERKNESTCEFQKWRSYGIGGNLTSPVEGIDVNDITHVFNYDLPNEPESYVHRIGRTARAGKSGIAYGFCDDTESGYLVGIQQLIGFDIVVDDTHEYHFIGAIPNPVKSLKK